MLRSDYLEFNPITAGGDGWEQFLGRVAINYYILGDRVLFLVTDSKNATSLFARQTPDWDRSTISFFGNTYQTYIWTEKITTVKEKVDEEYQRQIDRLLEEITKPPRYKW